MTAWLIAGSCFDLRWFTPTCEVSLCGHATLASAAVLFNSLGKNVIIISVDCCLTIVLCKIFKVVTKLQFACSKKQ